MADENISSTDSGSFTDKGRYPPQDGQMAPEELHRLLASDRRHLLSYLSTGASDSVSKDELIDVITERERPGLGPATDQVRTITDLHHVHLPKLADAGVIEYDPVAETVSYNAQMGSSPYSPRASRLKRNGITRYE